jgi:hypothetical protein
VGGVWLTRDIKEQDFVERLSAGREPDLGLASNVTPLHVLVGEPGAIDRLRAAS